MSQDKFVRLVRAQLRAKVDAVPVATRQRILDLMWAGKTVGDVCAQVNLPTDVVSQIIVDNIEEVSTLRKQLK